MALSETAKCFESKLQEHLPSLWETCFESVKSSVTRHPLGMCYPRKYSCLFYGRIVHAFFAFQSVIVTASLLFKDDFFHLVSVDLFIDCKRLLDSY